MSKTKAVPTAAARKRLLAIWRARAALRATGDAIWAEGVLSVVGDVAVDWRGEDCRLGTKPPMTFTVKEGAK